MTTGVTSVTSEYDTFEPRFPIGRGQFGIVFLLQHPDGRKAVDKRVELSGMTDKQKAETNAEIELLKKLAHPSICAYFHHFVTEDSNKPDTSTLHIVMEYCDSGSMADAVTEQQQAKRPFDHLTIRSWMCQLARALAHIHSLRVIHRDIKTANIFLSDVGKRVFDLKLGDFGISRLMSSQTNFASTAVGTPYYLSPELISGSGYDGRADVWAIGCILFELIALKRPFAGKFPPSPSLTPDPSRPPPCLHPSRQCHQRRQPTASIVFPRMSIIRPPPTPPTTPLAMGQLARTILIAR